MPIEFNCPQCHHRLRTPDGTEGRAAVCPNCSQQVTIPSESVPSTPPSPSPPSPTPEATTGDSPFGQNAANTNDPALGGVAASGGAFNPYAAPSTETELPQEGTVAELTPTQTNAVEILLTAWNTFRDNLMHFFLLGLVLMAIYIGGYIIGLVFGMLAALLGQQNMAIFWVFQVLAIIWAQIYGTFLSAVGVRYSLNVTAGSQEPMQGAFNILPYFVRLVLTQLLVVLLVYAVVLVCLAPLLVLIPLQDDTIMLGGAIFLGIIAFIAAIYVGIRLSLASPFIIDRNQGIVEAISSSAAYTKGNVLAIFLAALVILLLMIFLLIFTCGLGMVIFFPFQFMTIVLIYRLITGQQIGGQSPFSEEGAVTSEPGPSAGDTNPFAGQ